MSLETIISIAALGVVIAIGVWVANNGGVEKLAASSWSAFWSGST